MICSANELTALLRKAIVGSGIAVGLAEDGAAGATWLEARGLRGVRVVLDALAAESGVEESSAVLSSIRVGPSTVDRGIAEPGVEFGLTDVVSPLLLVGLLGVAADRYQLSGVLTFAGGEATVDKELERGVSISGIVPDRGDVVVRMAADPRGAGQSAAELPKHGIPVDPQEWGEAIDLAAKTYVPATEASRLKGAGAGLTDND